MLLPLLLLASTVPIRATIDVDDFNIPERGHHRIVTVAVAAVEFPDPAPVTLTVFDVLSDGTLAESWPARELDHKELVRDFEAQARLGWVHVQLELSDGAKTRPRAFAVAVGEVIRSLLEADLSGAPASVSVTFDEDLSDVEVVDQNHQSVETRGAPADQLRRKCSGSFYASPRPMKAHP